MAGVSRRRGRGAGACRATFASEVRTRRSCYRAGGGGRDDEARLKGVRRIVDSIHGAYSGQESGDPTGAEGQRGCYVNSNGDRIPRRELLTVGWTGYLDPRVRCSAELEASPNLRRANGRSEERRVG